jgi:hypothetical protein
VECENGEGKEPHACVCLAGSMITSQGTNAQFFQKVRQIVSGEIGCRTSFGWPIGVGGLSLHRCSCGAVVSGESTFRYHSCVRKSGMQKQLWEGKHVARYANMLSEVGSDEKTVCDDQRARKLWSGEGGH